MLKNLNIRNYALIEHLDLEFGDGLTIITGETGAGKSIMLGALSLVMGSRADTKVISDGDSKSVVEALFVDVDPNLRGLLEERGIDWITDESGVSELSVRREISTSGRSKIYVNDTSVTLQTLSLIVPALIDIHSQHANAKINLASERLDIIDAMACNEELRSQYKQLFGRYAETRRKIIALRKESAKALENLSFLKFQSQQLDRLKPRKGELREIESRFEILSDADEIRERLQTLLGLMGDYDRGVQSSLSEAAAVADKISNPTIVERIKAMLVEAKDIYGTLDDYYASVDSDPAVLARLSERMNAYYEAVKQFRVADADELVDIHAEIKRRIAGATGDDGKLKELEEQAKVLSHELRIAAEKLTASRLESAASFSALLSEKARTLGLPNVSFKAEVSPVKLTSTGQDEVEFLCSFNKNTVMRPVSEIASGGEISRLMLSLKSILAGHINLPTIIFDEVDTGVSGEIADKMGEMMHDVSSEMQVIVITHLPQVAAKGDEHFKVFKTDGDNKTVTRVSKLDRQGRIRELAAMISGSEISGAALSAAEELLGK